MGEEDRDYKPLFIEATGNYEHGNYEEAAKLYDQVLKLKPDYVDAYQNKGLALIECNRLDDAIFCFN